MKLLLVHGAWNYNRQAKIILFSFYKNICLYIIEVSKLWPSQAAAWQGSVMFICTVVKCLINIRGVETVLFRHMYVTVRGPKKGVSMYREHVKKQPAGYIDPDFQNGICNADVGSL